MGGLSKILNLLDPNLKIHNEGEWAGTESEYSAFNDAGLECEVGEFMYSMTRILKPRRVLETGTHWGIGASYIGLALKDNGFGTLDTIEFLPEISERARIRIKKMGLENYVELHEMDAAKFSPLPEVRYSLMLLDTEPDLRFNEFVRFYDLLHKGGFIFIHDLHRHMQQVNNEEHGFAWPFGKVPEFIDNLIRSGEIKTFHFPTPRGLTGFYKTSDDDYKPKERKL